MKLPATDRATLTEAQLRALRTVRTWAGRGDTYMPYANAARSYDACVRKGFMEYRTVDRGSPLNGYALTDAGRAALSLAGEKQP